MSDELRAARDVKKHAEMLLKEYRDEEHDDYESLCLIQAQLIVADAVLAQHHADDGVAVYDEAWLRNVGFVYDDEMESWLIFAPKETRLVPDDDGYEPREKTAMWPLTCDASLENWRFGESWLPKPQTRADVFNLARCLGVTLREVPSNNESEVG